MLAQRGADLRELGEGVLGGGAELVALELRGLGELAQLGLLALDRLLGQRGVLLGAAQLGAGALDLVVAAADLGLRLQDLLVAAAEVLLRRRMSALRSSKSSWARCSSA